MRYFLLIAFALLLSFSQAIAVEESKNSNVEEFDSGEESDDELEREIKEEKKSPSKASNTVNKEEKKKIQDIEDLEHLLETDNNIGHGDNYKKNNFVELFLLDKISAKRQTFKIKLFEKFEYKDYLIIPYNCLTNNIKSDNSLLLIGIWKKNEVANKYDRLFLGWLFSEDKNLNQIQNRFIDIANFKCY